jgi:hypothetical protein
MPYIHPRCVLPPGEWTNFVKVTETMKNFALTCIPKTNFSGVDVCLFDLCTCLDYDVEMNIRLANASQASMVVILSQTLMSVLQLRSSFENCKSKN